MVKVTICVGTACYVLGGAELLGKIDEFKARYGEAVRWEGSPCLGLCGAGGERKAPLVLVGDRVLERASAESLAALIDEVLREADYGPRE